MRQRIRWSWWAWLKCCSTWRAEALREGVNQHHNDCCRRHRSRSPLKRKRSHKERTKSKKRKHHDSDSEVDSDITESESESEIDSGSSDTHRRQHKHKKHRKTSKKKKRDYGSDSDSSDWKLVANCGCVLAPEGCLHFPAIPLAFKGVGIQPGNHLLCAMSSWTGIFFFSTFEDCLLGRSSRAKLNSVFLFTQCLQETMCCECSVWETEAGASLTLTSLCQLTQSVNYGKKRCVALLTHLFTQPRMLSLAVLYLIKLSWVFTHSQHPVGVSRSLSPDIITCGWLGLKHQLTNSPPTHSIRRHSSPSHDIQMGWGDTQSLQYTRKTMYSPR